MKEKSKITRVISYFRKITMTEKKLFWLGVISVILVTIISVSMPILVSRIVSIVSDSVWPTSDVLNQLYSVLTIIVILEGLALLLWRLVGFFMIPLETKNMKKKYDAVF